jgi:hypothetical protein
MNKRKPERNIIAGLVIGLILVVGIYVFFLLMGQSLDQSIDNQNKMLCNSAKVSGNNEYLDKCQIFYETGDIKYMRYVK